MNRKILLLTVALVFIVCDYSFAELFNDNGLHYIQKTLEGEINWSTMLVRSKGKSNEYIKGSVSIEKKGYTDKDAAVLDAYYNLYETVKLIPISSSYHVDDDVYIYPEAMKRVKDIVFKARVLSTQKGEDDFYETVVELNLTIDLLNAIYPKLKNLPAGKDVFFQGRGLYTSIIFDATKTDFAPVLMPQVQDSKGAAYYNLDKRNRPVASKSGLARYFRSIDAAKRSYLSGKKPYIVNDIQMSRYLEDTLVINAPLLDKIRNDAIVSEILGKCRVIIIVK